VRAASATATGPSATSAAPPTPAPRTRTTPTNRFTPTTGNFALDEQKPPAGTFSVVNNTLQNTGANGYVSGNFRFVADSAAGYVGANPGGTACTPAGNQCNLDFGGSDRVTVVFQQRLGTSGAFTTFNNSSSLTETATSSSYQWRMITLDVGIGLEA